MDKFLAILLFAVGILLVVKGGDFFVDAASWIAKALKVPTFIIGATIVSVATTMPEMLVSVIAAAQGKTDMAIGNAVGSVTANTALIMAIAMIAMNIVCPRKQYLKQILLFIASAVVLLVSSLTGQLNIIGSIVLIVIFLTFMALNVISGKKEMTLKKQAVEVTVVQDSETAELSTEEVSADGEGNAENTEDKQPAVTKKATVKNIILFIVGAAAIVGGSQLMVDKGSFIAEWIGIPERIISLTLIAIGTSLPELVTTITAIIKKESSLSIGNVIGANIIDLSLILPLCSLVSGKPIAVAQSSIILDLPVCLGVILIATLPLIFKQKAHKVQGIALIVLYVAYLVVTCLI